VVVKPELEEPVAALIEKAEADGAAPKAPVPTQPATQNSAHNPAHPPRQ
jgi:hypothetical protein